MIKMPNPKAVNYSRISLKQEHTHCSKKLNVDQSQRKITEFGAAGKSIFHVSCSSNRAYTSNESGLSSL